MAIEELTKIVAPPQSPREVSPDRVWEEIQEDLGITLPKEFRQLANTYGSGRFCRTFMIFNPFAPTYSECISFECDLLRQLIENEGEDYVPYEVFPQSPGLFPWGSDDNGHTMLWLTNGPADDWPIVLRSRDNEYERHDLSMTSFLARVLKQELSCILWPPNTFCDPRNRVFQAEEFG